MLSAPFPWFGGKRKVAAEVWRRFGAIDNYVEPFFGSGAVLLGRPSVQGIETINDLDGYVANFWRAVKHAPDVTAEYADWPVNENDLHARHFWLVQQRDTLRQRLEGDPNFYDPQIAGWWVWGIACWIGGGFCAGIGPWRINDDRQLVHLGDGGRVVNRKLVHLGTAGQGVKRQLMHLGDAGRGVNRKLVNLSSHGLIARERRDLSDWFASLAERLRHVRVCSGDWSRVCGPSVTWRHGMTGVFLDPPYGADAERTSGVYAEDSDDIAHTVREWAITNGEHAMLRIALCGYEGEHQMPSSWTVHAWNAGQGFGAQAETRSLNGRRERIWFSPACVPAEQPSLF